MRGTAEFPFFDSRPRRSLAWSSLSETRRRRRRRRLTVIGNFFLHAAFFLTTALICFRLTSNETPPATQICSRHT
jgi:hypothetical protein